MKNILIITCLFLLSVSTIQAQEIKIRADKEPRQDNPHVYIDGKKSDLATFQSLDQSEIASMNVVKGEQAIKEYNAPNGVFVIKTIKSAQKIVSNDEKDTKQFDSDKDPVFIINGTVSNKEALSKLSKEDVESINVIKGKEAIDQYNAPYGVLVVKTKN